METRLRDGSKLALSPIAREDRSELLLGAVRGLICRVLGRGGGSGERCRFEVLLQTRRITANMSVTMMKLIMADNTAWREESIFSNGLNLASPGFVSVVGGRRGKDIGVFFEEITVDCFGGVGVKDGSKC